jgi:hypothetical protein
MDHDVVSRLRGRVQELEAGAYRLDEELTVLRGGLMELREELDRLNVRRPAFTRAELLDRLDNFWGASRRTSWRPSPATLAAVERAWKPEKPYRTIAREINHPGIASNKYHDVVGAVYVVEFERGYREPIEATPEAVEHARNVSGLRWEHIAFLADITTEEARALYPGDPSASYLGRGAKPSHYRERG